MAATTIHIMGADEARIGARLDEPARGTMHDSKGAADELNRARTNWSHSAARQHMSARGTGICSVRGSCFKCNADAEAASTPPEAYDIVFYLCAKCDSEGWRAWACTNVAVICGVLCGHTWHGRVAAIRRRDGTLQRVLVNSLQVVPGKAYLCAQVLWSTATTDIMALEQAKLGEELPDLYAKLSGFGAEQRVASASDAQGQTAALWTKIVPAAELAGQLPPLASLRGQNGIEFDAGFLLHIESLLALPLGPSPPSAARN